MRRRRERFGERLAELRLSGPERRAAAAERASEAALELERYPAVCLAERRRAKLEAESRRWGSIYGVWKF